MEPVKYFIAWNEDKTEGAIFTDKRDAQSALDGKDWIDPKMGFPSISSLAEAFFDVYGDDDCIVEEVTIKCLNEVE